MSQVKTKGLQKVQEKILIKSSHAMTFPEDTEVLEESIDHTVGKQLYVDYIISIDGGSTYISPERYRDGSLNLQISCSADKDKIYFSVLNVQEGTPENDEYDVVFQYRAYVLESTNA